MGEVTAPIQQFTDFSSSVSWLVHFCQQRHIKALFYNRQYEVNERRRDVQLEQALSGQVVCHSFDDSLLLPPGRVKTGQGEMYKVYTPFRRAFLQQLTESDVSSLPAPSSRGEPIASGVTDMFDYAFAEVCDAYPAGEEAALQRLRDFCRERVQDYVAQRDFPAIVGTSNLSPYLAIGVLSPASVSTACGQNAPTSWITLTAVLSAG